MKPLTNDRPPKWEGELAIRDALCAICAREQEMRDRAACAAIRQGGRIETGLECLMFTPKNSRNV